MEMNFMEMQKEREVPLPTDVVGELAKYMLSRGLDADPEDIGNQGGIPAGQGQRRRSAGTGG